MVHGLEVLLEVLKFSPNFSCKLIAYISCSWLIVVEIMGASENGVYIHPSLSIIIHHFFDKPMEMFRTSARCGAQNCGPQQGGRVLARARCLGALGALGLSRLKRSVTAGQVGRPAGTSRICHLRSAPHGTCGDTCLCLSMV
jgi:hypothetical protein